MLYARTILLAFVPKSDTRTHTRTHTHTHIHIHIHTHTYTHTYTPHIYIAGIP